MKYYNTDLSEGQVYFLFPWTLISLIIGFWKPYFIFGVLIGLILIPLMNPIIEKQNKG